MWADHQDVKVWSSLDGQDWTLVCPPDWSANRYRVIPPEQKELWAAYLQGNLEVKIKPHGWRNWSDMISRAPFSPEDFYILRVKPDPEREFMDSLTKAVHDAGGNGLSIREDTTLAELRDLCAPNGIRFTCEVNK
tara:strand:- start:39390 stop:39794 length:405 start_codon:yes stop_codon:yes gene_type:complete